MVCSARQSVLHFTAAVAAKSWTAGRAFTCDATRFFAVTARAVCRGAFNGGNGGVQQRVLVAL
jgi:hypothetical protein